MLIIFRFPFRGCHRTLRLDVLCRKKLQGCSGAEHASLRSSLCDAVGELISFCAGCSMDAILEEVWAGSFCSLVT